MQTFALQCCPKVFHVADTFKWRLMEHKKSHCPTLLFSGHVLVVLSSFCLLEQYAWWQLLDKAHVFCKHSVALVRSQEFGYFQDFKKELVKVWMKWDLSGMLHVSRHENSHCVSPANPQPGSVPNPWTIVSSNQGRQVIKDHFYRCFVRLQSFVEVCVVNKCVKVINWSFVCCHP